MVLPERIIRAATRASFVLGDGDHISAWLESGRSVDDVDDVSECTMLLFATYGPHPPERPDLAGQFDEEHVALARYLLTHGADVNRSNRHGYTPLHYASFCFSESSPAMAALLLKAGANVLMTNDNRNNPLTIVLMYMAKNEPSRPRIEIALLLLRALPSLDCAWTNSGTLVHSAEWVLNWAERQANPPLPPGNCFQVLSAVVAGVRAAGGWRAYDRRPREEVLRLLILAQRRRAILTAPTRHDGQYIRTLGFLVRCPPEIAWQILGYWRCQYPVATDIIDQLGYR